MAEITASLVKELREKTGAGMMDCKKALTETAGDMEAAIDWLRTKGLAKAAKKADRVAAEGLVAVATEGTRGAVVEVNSETDFVARNDKFQEMAGTIAKLALASGGSLDTLSGASYPGTSGTVQDHLTGMIASIGENMSLRRVATLEVSDGVVASYVHNQVAPGMGKIGVLVALESSGDKATLEALGRQIAMHIAATSPMSLRKEDLDAAAIERERAVLVEQARESGKPEAVIEKMVEGRLRKFYEEVCLLEQTYVIDGESRVGQVVEAAAKDAGAPVDLIAFVRFTLGEGIEKEEQDFASEVAAAAGG
ncbi:translation elongation factor Ts [Futiania mangrovi]|uniref:Elongation factor Ts n=1 Tax=Futiania mangrovi TaxID=2959716 RepID=A0A9J6PBG7_9PROT|nr:translation elongation factor Ts [Futiania mangrovii]MCP1335825.1 translation elongation factor Ts [Futiania mangrovii]